ncbi:rRNA N6-adenosine-methyltransferase ZCCHC4 isoform X2 [Monodelphis domestica]|uniref:rRNA N6-adenosine-methyltransferase ZCCHC4 isoform X2 n=1 Tax=Monodelphis domestica TaxID=13616 RepID=UPI0004434398|nr:rRNA N6-adenosine-methyltransferase ZCCHC4 isoform X2 [Monodelphis domestica]
MAAPISKEEATMAGEEEATAAAESTGRRRRSGVEVLVSQDTSPSPPQCPHGPTLLFVKVSQGKEEARRFYACSACRDRKDCNFFQWEDEKLSEARLAARETHNRRCQPPLSHMQYVKRYWKFIELPLSQRKFCQTCQQLLLPDDGGKHFDHQVLCDISIAQLRRPSQLLYPLENKKTNAQYLFTNRSCQFLLDLICTLGFRKVLCVGTPRYSQFYMEDNFCHYNMFNHHFFNGKAAFETCRKFLQEDKDVGLILVADPPFGGLVEPLAVTFRKFMDMWRETQSPDNNSKELPLFWIFPYFFESRILQFFPSFSMLDYQVDYDNHTLYKHGKTGRKQSPVRIFTNIPPNKIILPIEEGYRFCTMCQRYVSLENQHCEICNSCTSKDGRRWKHCLLCKKCVKPSWIHCSICNYCALPNHSCAGAKDGCFICGEADHKRTTCSNFSAPKRANKAVRKQKPKKRNKMKMETTKGQSMNHATVRRKKKKKRRGHQYPCS